MVSQQQCFDTHTERLWTAPDGTVCILATCDAPPYYSITLVRNAEVLCEQRLYGRATAQMIAQGWRDRRDDALDRS